MEAKYKLHVVRNATFEDLVRAFESTREEEGIFYSGSVVFTAYIVDSEESVVATGVSSNRREAIQQAWEMLEECPDL